MNLHAILLALALGTTVACPVAGSEPAVSSPEAVEAVKRAPDAAPKDAALASRQCELLTQRGQQAEAIEACRRALASEASPANLRAVVAALVHGGKSPTPSQLIEAAMLVRGMRRSSPQGVYTRAAECDIYEGLGDWPALAECSAQLGSLYPQHGLAKRVSAVLDAHRAKWYVSVGWWLVASSLLVALASWMRAKLARPRNRIPRAGAAILAGIGLLVVSPHAWGDTPKEQPGSEPTGQMSRFTIDPRDPEASIPPDSEKNQDPLHFGYLLMDLTDRAEQAQKSGDHPAAIRYFRALAKAVPDRAISFSRLCAEYQAINDRALALSACRKALGLGGVTIQDHLRFVDLVIAAPGTLSPEAVNELDDIVQHLRRESKDAAFASTVECKVGLRLKDRARMSRCTEHLGRVAPRDPQTISYQWAYAVMRNDFTAARGFISNAKDLEMSPEAIKNMERATESAVPWTVRVQRYGWFVATALVFGLFCFAVWFAARRRERLPAGAPTGG